MPKILRTTAAWRISIWTTLAFALGTGLAFAIVYLLVAQTIRDRSDAWLSGEADVLAQVSADTPRDHLYTRIVGEVAELATRELPDERNSRGQRLNSVFFLEYLDANGSPLWVGPGSVGAFLTAIQGTKFGQAPQSIRVEGWPMSFRVVARHVDERGKTIYLGLSNRGDTHLLDNLTRRFLLLWGGTVFLGFLISYLSARRTLLRVEHITGTVARIGSEDLSERLPESVRRDEIAQLAKTFNLMLDRIQSSVNQLRSVTDAVAHDLKSPVTSIRGKLESALCSEPDENWRDSVGEAIEDLDRLLNLLNTTLDLAEAEAGALRLDRTTVDLSGVIRQLVELYQPAMCERQHELTADLETRLVVSADLSLLSRVVSNLLENEMIHLPPGCRIHIQLRPRQESADLVIEDNGPGFPPEVAGHAFERFVKGKHSPGHGLGLAFVDAVVKAHGGAVRISNRPIGGTVITLSLPTSVLQPALL
ncbi:MAG: ATP-binding protein [Candidatus Acidiferrales bacterium]